MRYRLVGTAGLAALAALTVVAFTAYRSVTSTLALHRPAAHASLGGLAAAAMPDFVTHLPVVFEPNRGQADSRAQYLAHGPGYSLLLSPGETVIKLRRPDTNVGASWRTFLLKLADRASPKSATLRLRLLDANEGTSWVGLEEREGRSHYFLGNRPDAWLAGVPQFGRVQSQQVYDGIDLVFYGQGQELEYDFIVAPGRDPGKIRWRVDGADSVALQPDGDLLLTTAVGDIRLRHPVIYQTDTGGARQAVAGGFRLVDGHTVGFDIGPYDRNRPLIIDPVVTYVALFGGSGNTTVALGLAVDTSGSPYISGATCDLQYPATPASLQNQGGGVFGDNGCEDAFVTKLSSDGTSLVYSTFIGGADSDGAGRIAVDSTGAAYVTGITLSADFPTTTGAYSRTFAAGNCTLAFGSQVACADAFVTKLAPDGSQLVYSTYVGGSRFDLGGGIAIDETGAAYVQGWTNSTNFPVTAGVAQGTYAGGTCFAGFAPCYDAFVTKLTPDGSQLVYATYLGGSSQEYAFSIAVDAGHNAYVTGSTESTDFPVTSGAYQTTPAAGADQPDAYVAKLNPAGTALVYATYLGGAGNDLAYDIRPDTGGTALIAGTTDSADFPTTSGAWKTTADLPGGFTCSLDILQFIICGEGFVTRINATGTALGFSTFIGGSYTDAVFAVLPAANGDVWVGGRTVSTDLPTTPDALYAAQGGFLARLAADGKTLRYLSGISKSTTSFSDAVTSLQIAGADLYAGGMAGGALGVSSTTPGSYTNSPALGVYVLKLDTVSSPATLSVTPTQVSFGPQPLYAATPPRNVTITNTGAVAASIAVSVVDNASNGGPDEFVESDNCGAVLAAGATCTAQVAFRPTSRTGRSARLSVTSNTPGSPALVGLDGRGQQIDSARFIPPTLTFAARAAGTTSAQQPTSLDIQAENFPTPSGVATGGANPGDFAVDSSQCSPPNFGCYLRVAFAPQAGGAPGPRSATVSVSTTAANSPHVLTLSGTVGTGALIEITPSRLDFDNVAVGQGTTFLVTVRNAGDVPLALAAPAVAGTDFSIEATNCGASLAVQASCVVTVKLAPTGTGARTGTLTLTDNAPGSPHVVQLAGLGVDGTGPVLSISVDQLDFAAVAVGRQSVVPLFARIQNLGLGPATGLTPVLTGDYVFQSNPCPATLAASAACILQINFAPTAEGTRTGSLTVTSSAPGSPRVFSFTGVGVRLPVGQLTPAVLDFGNQAIGVASALKTATLTNSGDGPLNIASLSATAPFAIVASTCGSTVPPAGSCTLDIALTPAGAGPVTGTLQVVDNASGGRQTTGLRGGGTGGPALMVSPLTLDFGSQPANTTSAAQTITVTNTGGQVLALAGISAGRNFSQTNNCGSTLAPGASCGIQARFAPTKPSPLPDFVIVGTISIASPTPGSPTQVTVQGIGTSAGPAIGITPPAGFAFGTVTIGGAPTQEVVLANTGNASLTISNIALAGASAAEFALVAPASGTDCRTAGTLAASGNCRIALRFTPASAGVKSVAVRVTDNVPGSPQTIGVSASGGSGGGGPPAVTLSAGSVDLGVANVGGTAIGTPVTVSNTGTGLLNISGITVTGANPGDFTTSTSCGATLAAGATCTVTPRFTPATTGSRSASVEIADDAAGSPQTISLTGTAADFALVPIVPPAPLAAGSSTDIPVTLDTGGSPLAQDVTFSAEGLPAGTTASFSPATQPAGATAPATVLTLTTTARPGQVAVNASPGGSDSPRLATVIGTGPGILWLAGLAFTSRRERRRIALALLVSISLIGVAACSNNGSDGPSAGTPAGTYTITVKATAGTVVRSATVPLTVN